MIPKKAYEERSDSSQGNSKILALTLNSYNLWSLKKMLELKEDKMNMGIIAPRGGGQKKKIKREGRGQELQVLWGDNMMVVRGVSGQTILLWGHAKASRIYEKWWDPFICHLVVHHFPSPNQFAPPSSLQLGSLGFRHACASLFGERF